MRANGFAVRVVCIVVSIVLTVIGSERAAAAVSANGDNSANPTTQGADPSIGLGGLGRLTINGGNGVISDGATVGDLPAGIGLVSVTDFNSSTGTPSSWTTNVLYVGDAGMGRLEILNGALVTVDAAGTPGTGDFVVGNFADGVGTVIVSGLGSMLKMGDDTVIGQLGTGTLRIENEGYVLGTNSAAGDTDIFTVGVRGRLEFGNGRLKTEVFTNHGTITGTGRIDNINPIGNSPTGHIDIGAGQRFVINAILDNDGAIAIDGGEMEFFKALTNSAADAEITLRDQGILRVSQTGFGFDSTSGVLAATGGTNDVYGTVRIQTAASKILSTGGSTLVFHDPVTNTGGQIEVFAGSSIVYLQGLTTTGTSSMTVSLADPETTPSNAVTVTGDASIAGNLNVNLASGFKPSAGDAFEIVSATGTVTGSLNIASAPTLPGGMKWNLLNTGSDISLSVVATGDYNGNGSVDAGDYVVWRNSQNQQGPGLAADSNGDGFVNTADYSFWRSRVGNVVSGTGSGGAVPEPAAIALILCGAVLCVCSRRFVPRHYQCWDGLRSDFDCDMMFLWKALTNSRIQRNWTN